MHSLPTCLIRATALALMILPSQSTLAQAATPADYDADAALRQSQAALGNKLGDYELLDTAGNSFQLADFAGKPLLISLVFTSCYHTCPVTTRRLAIAAANAREVLGRDSFHMVTIGFDSVNDSPENMRAFARAQGIDVSNWDFLSGTPESVAKLIADLGFVFFPSPRGFDHIVQLTIVNRDGVVYRQIYGESFELPALMEPLKDLVFNRPRSTNDPLAGLTDRVKLFCTVYDPATGRYKFDYSLFIQTGVGLLFILSVSIYLIREARRARRQK